MTTSLDDKKRHGVIATNREYGRYDQVEKKQVYHLADTGADEFDEDYEIRTCDLGLFLRGNERDRQRFVTDLGEALRDIGFAILEGHGIDTSLYEEAGERIAEVLAKPSLEEKMRYRAKRHGSVNQGYFPIRETSDIHPDLVEGWVFCRRAFDMGADDRSEFRERDFWPVEGVEPFFREIVLAQESLILPVMQSMLDFLGADPHSYDERLTRTNVGLRLNYFPPLSSEDEALGATRLLGHEDVDLFTFLPAPRIEGLQVLNRQNMKWIRLNAPRGTIILNTGDYMQRISNDLFPSTTHRVGRPRDGRRLLEPRVSFPMAVYLWEDEWLEVLPNLENPRYERIRAIEFHTATTSKFYGDEYAVRAES